MSDRPGGWVEGIGWVAEVRELGDGDEFWIISHLSGETQKFVMDAGWRQVRYCGLAVTVFRWSDGSPPEPPNRVPDDPNAEVRMTLVMNAVHYAREGKWERAYMDLSTACGLLSDATGQPIADALDRITEAAPDPWWKRVPDVTKLPEWADLLDALSEPITVQKAQRVYLATCALKGAVDSRG